MTNAQRQAFIHECETGNRFNKRQLVYKAVCQLPCSSLEGLLQLLNAQGHKMKMSTLSGRVSELLDMGVIEETGLSVGNVSFFKPVDCPSYQQHLFEQRSKQRYEKWVKQGKQNGYFERYTRDFWD